jgi:hypothetical protein
MTPPHGEGHPLGVLVALIDAQGTWYNRGRYPRISRGGHRRCCERLLPSESYLCCGLMRPFRLSCSLRHPPTPTRQQPPQERVVTRPYHTQMRRQSPSVGDHIKVYGADRRKMDSDFLPPGEGIHAAIVTPLRQTATFLPSLPDGKTGPHDHPGGVDGSASIGTARL